MASRKGSKPFAKVLKCSLRTGCAILARNRLATLLLPQNSSSGSYLSLGVLAVSLSVCRCMAALQPTYPVSIAYLFLGTPAASHFPCRRSSSCGVVDCHHCHPSSSRDFADCRGIACNRVVPLFGCRGAGMSSCLLLHPSFH